MALRTSKEKEMQGYSDNNCLVLVKLIPQRHTKNHDTIDETNCVAQVKSMARPHSKETKEGLCINKVKKLEI